MGPPLLSRPPAKKKKGNSLTYAILFCVLEVQTESLYYLLLNIVKGHSQKSLSDTLHMFKFK